MKLDDLTWELICDLVIDYDEKRTSKNEFLKRLYAFVNMQLEVAEGVGFNEGYYKRTDEGLKLVNDSNYKSDKELAARGNVGAIELVEYTDEHLWQNMLAADSELTRKNH